MMKKPKRSFLAPWGNFKMNLSKCKYCESYGGDLKDRTAPCQKATNGMIVRGASLQCNLGVLKPLSIIDGVVVL